MKNFPAFGYLISALLGASLLWAGSLTGQKKPNWHLVYEHSKTGVQVQGSKDALISAVRDGKLIRVYFRGRRVEHLTDATFITVFGGEVFAQISAIETQSPSMDPPKVHFRAPGTKWRAILGTTGEFSAFADGKDPNIRTQAVKWYVAG